MDGYSDSGRDINNDIICHIDMCSNKELDGNSDRNIRIFSRDGIDSDKDGDYDCIRGYIIGNDMDIYSDNNSYNDIDIDNDSESDHDIYDNINNDSGNNSESNNNKYERAR